MYEMKLLPQHQNLNFLTTLLLLILIIRCISGNVNSLVDVDDNKSNDQLALTAFKNEITEDPNWILSSWNNNNDSLHFCKWRGVTCSRHHRNRVTVLDLNSQGLVGSISPHIGNLSFLKDLLLINNSLTGEIPPQIGRLFRLKRLSLSYNSVDGEIPGNISGCFNLRHLNITNNNLVGRIPRELGYLSNLTILDVGYNKLSGEVPSSLGNLSSLTYLNLGFNNLEGSIPSSLSRLISLRKLGLLYNMFSGHVPSSFYNISSLEVFSLMRNQLHGSIPSDIGITLPNLKIFSLSYNNFTGTIPSSISNMSRLEELELQTNGFTGSLPYNLVGSKKLIYFNVMENILGSRRVNDLSFLTSLVNCTNLQILAIRTNNLGGTLPSSIANLTAKLEVIDFGIHYIYGIVPTGIQNLVGLTNLYLDFNFFTGSLPSSIGNLKNLGRLDVTGSKFSGSIPASFGNLTQLVHLALINNNFTGVIPSSIGNCKALQILDLSFNRFSGRIPIQVFELPSLSDVLNLLNNSFTGPLPAEVGNLKNLGVFDLSENKVSGEIPSAIGECLSLTFLNLQGNLFQGNIPPAITSLKGLETLSVSRNNLSGIIPKGLENLTALSVLDLSYNNLEGEVPKDGAFKNISTVSVEGNNKLCGGIPDLKLQNCSMPLNPDTKRKPRKLSIPVKVIAIIVVIAVLLLTFIVFFLILHWRRKSKTKPSLTSLDVGNRYMGVSYNELLKATNAFNDTTNLLGVGSFGSVYKGILQQDESTPVAVKVLHLQQRGATKSFMAECDALRRVRHRNLLKIITCCSSTDFQGNPFKALVFEFMVNGSLENWLHTTVSDTNNDDQLQEKNLNLERRLNIAVDVAFALNYLHHDSQSPIVHCDVKPSNVLLDDDLTAHVGDFGLAKFLVTPSNSSQLNEQDASSIAIKGSIGYVAPEYGIGGEVSTQGDVYSYGILLLEMFTGKRPTDEMFKDGLNIRHYSKMHELPERIEEVIDSRLLFEFRGDHNDAEITNYNMSRNNGRNIAKDTMRQILASIIQIGIKCSSELPSDRSSMNEVVVDVQAVKNRFIGVGL